MAKKKSSSRGKVVRRRYTEEFKEEAVQMLLDGHSAVSVAERLGLSGTNILYRWKQQVLANSGPVAGSLKQRLHEVEAELRRTRQERDILKKRSPFSAATADRHLSRHRSDHRSHGIGRQNL